MTNDSINFSLNPGLNMGIERQKEYGMFEAAIHSVSSGKNQVPHKCEQLLIVQVLPVSALVDF